MSNIHILLGNIAERQKLKALLTARTENVLINLWKHKTNIFNNIRIAYFVTPRQLEEVFFFLILNFPGSSYNF